MLGAVDSLPVGVDATAAGGGSDAESPGQGVSEGPRFYDYGPGSNFGAVATFLA